jgi:hypothetical protein
MSTALAKQEPMAILEQVVIHGDLSKLTPQDRVMYYKQVCDSVGLNPLTRPFEYITLNGKLRLYALRDATDQLRKLNGVSIIIAAREVVEDCYVVTAQATDKAGRKDESIGVVPIAALKGEFRSNAMMKAETKAKRRVTLSICGMGWLEESEVDSIPGAKPTPFKDDDITEQIGEAAPELLSDAQADELATALSQHNKDAARLLRSVSKRYGKPVAKLSEIRAADFADAMTYATAT